MAEISAIYRFLIDNVGFAGAANSTSGVLNAKLGMLMPYANGTTGTVLCFPSTLGVAFATTTYTTIVSSGTFSAHMLTGVYVRTVDASTTTFIAGQTNQQGFDIATGAAGAEVVVATLYGAAPVPGSTTPNNTYAPVAIFPPIQWPTNERIAARVGGSSSGPNVTVAVGFSPRPI